jgi:superfamily II DNA/RNA helicase
MGRSGQAITLMTATDLSKLQEIERGLGRKLPRVSSTQTMDGSAPIAQVAAPAKPVRPMRRWGRRRVRA